MKKLKFIEETHTYLYGNKVIPSVSQLINFEFDKPYKDVPKDILAKAASYGTQVHEAIEAYIKKEFTLADVKLSHNLDPNIKSAILSADEIIKKYMLDIKSMEQKATYKGRYAGTYDLLTNDKDLIDIKTTSKLHKDYLAVQLGLYYMMLGIKKEYGYCMWIPKNQKAQFVIIKCWNYEECEDLLNRYEQSIAKQKRVSDNSKHTMLTQASLF